MMNLNCLVVLAASASPAIGEVTPVAQEVPTGVPATKIFGIIACILIMLAMLIIIVAWAITKTRPIEKAGKAKDDAECFDEEDEEHDEEDCEIELDLNKTSKDDGLAAWFSPKKEPVEKEPEEELVVEEEKVEESRWVIPEDATLLLNSGDEVRFYDYHKTDSSKLLVSEKDNDSLKWVDIAEVKSISAAGITTVRLSKGLLVIEGNVISFIDSLTGKKAFTCSSRVHDELKLCRIPEGNLSDESGKLGEIISEKVDYREKVPAIFYQDNTGVPHRMMLDSITKLEISSKDYNMWLEAVAGTDLICMGDLTCMTVLQTSTGKIIAKS